MTINEFKAQCKRTCPNLGNDKTDLAHMVLGMNSEIVEIQEALIIGDNVNLSEEIADYIWYFCNYVTFRGLDINELLDHFGPTYSLLGLYNNTSKLQDIVKKYLAYGKKIDVKEEKFWLRRIYASLRGLSEDTDISIGSALDRNIEKLKQRYPEGFKEEDAISRDLVAERKILEGNG